LAMCCLSMAALGTTTYYTSSQNQNQTIESSLNFSLNSSLENSMESILDSPLRWMSLVSLIVFVLGFTIGLGPVPWILLGELRPGNNDQISGIFSHHWSSFIIVASNFILPISLLTYLEKYKSKSHLAMPVTNDILMWPYKIKFYLLNSSNHDVFKAIITFVVISILIS
jgi:hypothetical protein